MFDKGKTLHDVLVDPKNKTEFQCKGKDYTSLGFFVTDIGSLHSGGGKNLLYYVNDKEASVGVSNYIPQSGDRIDWKLE